MQQALDDRRPVQGALPADQCAAAETPGLAHAFDVGARRERGALTRQHDHAHRLIGLGLVDQHGEAIVHLRQQRVARLRPVEGDRRDSVGDCVEDVLFHRLKAVTLLGGSAATGKLRPRESHSEPPNR